MNICICTDSRGSLAYGGANAWVSLFRSWNPQHTYFTSLWESQSFTTLLDHAPIILATQQQYDIAIIQLGYHDYVVPWPMTMWQLLKGIDPNVEEHLTRFPDCTIGQHRMLRCYHYRNDAVIKKCFDDLHTRCKKILFISLPYNWPEYYEKTVMMNAVFSQYCDASIQLPIDPEFPKNNTFYTELDRVHYTAEYSKVLAGLVHAQVAQMLSAS